MTYIWFIIAFILLILELVSGTFILLFFSIGAACAAIANILGLSTLFHQVLLFSGIGVLCLGFFWKRIFSPKNHNPVPGIDVGNEIIVATVIEPHQEAQVEYQGTVWTAQNTSNHKIEIGEKVRITEVRGVKLIITPIKKLNK